MAVPDRVVSIGKTDLQVTQLGLGSASLGFLYSPVDDSQAQATVHAALERGLRLFDTSPLYGAGAAEVRMGSVLSGILRESFVLSTKAGYDIEERPPDSLAEFPSDFYFEAPRDFSYDGILRSLERSLRRLGLDRVDIVHIHDPDDRFDEAMRGAYRALDQLRSKGVIRALGVGMNQAELLTRFAREGDFDCFLLAGRYTLLDQTGGDDLLPLCKKKGISVIAGGVYNSGILAQPEAQTPTYNYLPAEPHLVEKAYRIERVCSRHKVPLKAAAIQFPLTHPAVCSVLAGARSAPELMENYEMFQFPVPEDLWNELRTEGLLR